MASVEEEQRVEALLQSVADKLTYLEDENVQSLGYIQTQLLAEIQRSKGASYTTVGGAS